MINEQELESLKARSRVEERELERLNQRHARMEKARRLYNEAVAAIKKRTDISEDKKLELIIEATEALDSI